MRKATHSLFLLPALFIALPVALFSAEPAQAEITALIDLRALASSTDESWLDRGLGKNRFADEHSGLQLGQAVLEARGQLADTVSGKIGINAYGDREEGVDLTEAFLTWKPLPIAGGLRFKTKVGAFFPLLSLENEAPGWTSPWTVSTSAINTWVGEELRTIGTEVSLSRPGALHDSPHDVEILASGFTANDPAGALIAWRGWSVGDRVTGLTERLAMPDIPIFNVPFVAAVQRPWEEPFHEIDHEYGYYAGVNYGYNGWLTLRALHYDNGADPAAIKSGQWAWYTEFDHLGLRVDLPQDWTVMTQAMSGTTYMGMSGLVDNEFESWYLLVSKPFGKNRFTLRYDDFVVEDYDGFPNDDNSEDGDALALTWLCTFNKGHSAGIEALSIRSVRAARQFLHGANNPAAGREDVEENSLQAFYRWQL